jgi:hypothetical protein
MTCVAGNSRWLVSLGCLSEDKDSPPQLTLTQDPSRLVRLAEELFYGHLLYQPAIPMQAVECDETRSCHFPGSSVHKAK